MVICLASRWTEPLLINFYQSLYVKVWMSTVHVFWMPKEYNRTGTEPEVQNAESRLPYSITTTFYLIDLHRRMSKVSPESSDKK